MEYGPNLLLFSLGFFCETEAHIYNEVCQEFDMKFETNLKATSPESV